jgi:hypothetical protein
MNIYLCDVNMYAVPPSQESLKPKGEANSAKSNSLPHYLDYTVPKYSIRVKNPEINQVTETAILDLRLWL